MRLPALPHPGLLEDRALRWALLVGAWLRLWPLARWPSMACVRDECTYLALAERLLEGQGITPAARGWLWAPGYPALLAAHGAVFGSMPLIRVTQVLLSLLTVVLAYALTRRLVGEDGPGRRAARWAAWLFALSPTLVFFAGRLWSETVYLTLLLGALLALGAARQAPGLGRALGSGALVGLCVLLRGVATYLLPIFALGLLWGRWRERRAWAQVAALGLGAVLTVGPYTAHATARWGALTISDHTLGQMMWLGNNSFPPVTFDHGVGLTEVDAYDAVTSQGRPHCVFTGNPAQWNACEVAAGRAWIAAHPGEFLRRVPLRLAQLFNPNSFLTRFLAQQDLQGAPTGLGLAGATVLWSGLAVLGGTLGLLALGRGWLAVVCALVLAYHMAAIALVAGLTRYRVPLDGLWLLWAAALLARPAQAWAWLRAEPLRVAGALALLPALLALCLRLLRPGFL